VRGREELVLAQVAVAIEHDGRALGTVGVLVQIHRDARDAIDREVEVWHLVAELAEVGEQEAADAGVHVHPHAALLGQGRELHDRIHDAVGVGG